MKLEDIKHGAKLWCITNSNETMNNHGPGDPLKPVRPWLGLVDFENKVDDRFDLRRFNRETGRINYDTNANASVGPELVFATEKEAADVYSAELGKYANRLIALIGEACDEMWDYQEDFNRRKHEAST